MKLSLGEKRKHREIAYSIFEGHYSMHESDNSLPDGKYYRPTDMVLFDLIKKEDLQYTKKGLERLFKNCFCHKHLWGGKSESDIEDMVNGLDQTLNSGNSWYNIGIFDYAYNSLLESYIDHFDLCFHNFSSSYVAVEIHVTLATPFVNELSDFIKEHYKKPGMCVHRHWGRKKGKSGAKIINGFSSGVSSEYAKSQIIYEQLQYVKNIFLKELKKYFPLMQYSRNGKIYGINVFETNITTADKLDKAVYAGLGLNERYGFNFSYAERLYILTETMGPFESDESDMMFVFNPDKIDDYEMFQTPHNKAVHQLKMDYMDKLYRGVILKDIGIGYLNLISHYRNQVNKFKPHRINHRRLLKLKYQISNDFYDFKKIDEELPVDVELDKINNTLKEDSFTSASIYYGLQTAKMFDGLPRQIWKQIRSNCNEVENDIDRKLEISSSLTSYSAGKQSMFLVGIQVILATLTFYFLVFPDKAAILASWLLKIREILP